MSLAPATRVLLICAVVLLFNALCAVCSEIEQDEDTHSRHLLQAARVQTPAQIRTRNHNHKLHRIHGWLMGLSWGWFIPAGVVVASFRSFTKVGSAWFYVHVISATLGLLLSLAGTAVACYFPANEKLQHQHKVIGIVIQVVAGLQVLVGIAARPPKTKMLRRAWNLGHWTVGRAVLALAIANFFIGADLSHINHKHTIAQAVVLGGLFIIYMLRSDIEYMLVKQTPAEEERLMKAAQQPGADIKAYNVEMAHPVSNGTNGVSGKKNGVRTVV